MAIIDDLFSTFASKAAQLHWDGTRGETSLTEVKPSAGTDLARGPWIKFDFKENGKVRSVQGYFLFAGGERVKLDGNIEVDNDDVNIEVNGTHLVATFSGKRNVNGQLFAFSYLFSAKLV